MAHLCCADLPPGEFLQLVQNNPWPDDALLMASTAAEARFTRYKFDPEFFAQCDQGRIFSAAGEFRWRSLGRLLRLVYLGDAPVPETLADYSSELDGLVQSRRQFLLWGVRTDTKPQWLEQQVPHLFDYPVDTAQYSRGRAALIVEDWEDTAGIPRFSRYHSITEVKGEK